MIPLQLTLQNFLSYREVTLDFLGFHTACICGANGAGKSSLLEAITWAIWGKSRAASEDDVIHAGAKNVRVDFTFISNKQTYRVIRSRQRGRSSALEFQIATEADKFRSLSGKGIKATQQCIIAELKLDYDTFINSSYLRQGRADEFMLRRPSERKQILADLLKLEQYEELATQAKDTSKQFKGKAEQLEQSLQPLQEQLAQRQEIEQQRSEVATSITQLQQEQDKEREQLQQLQAVEHQRQNWQQQHTWQKTQYQNLQQDCLRLEQDRSNLESQLSELQTLLNQGEEITQGYQKWQSLQQQEASLAAKFQAYQDAQLQKQQLEQQLSTQLNELNLQIRHQQSRLEALEQQEEEIATVVKSATEVSHALATLHAHRQRLRELDELQLQVSPLLQQHNRLQTQLEKTQVQLTAKLEQLRTSAQEISTQMTQVSQMRQSALAVESQISELDKKQVRRQWIGEKGQERKAFQERLQEQQRNCEKQIAELHQKLEMLQTPGVGCPLCEQKLDEQLRQRVIQKTQIQHQDIQEAFWIAREQIATSEKELQILRSEYAQLNKELSAYDTLMQQKGQLEAQMDASAQMGQRLQIITEETQHLEQSLDSGNYAQELQTQLQIINQQLEQLNYDEQTHALVRGEVERWRWAEIRQAKIEDAQRRQTAIKQQKPELTAKIALLEQSIQQLYQDSPLQQQINSLDAQIAALDYSRTRHNELIEVLHQAQQWQLRQQQLQQAQQQYPALQSKLEQLEEVYQEKLDDLEVMEVQLQRLVTQIEQLADNRQTIATLEAQIHQRRCRLDDLLAKRGSLVQQLSHLEQLESQYEETCQHLQRVRQQYRVYQELAQAFGKNGIQALMIENILPQLEEQTNQILARLTGNQLHVQFLTQKAGKSSRSRRKKDTKLIDTLEILIADTRGTRAYETYSGGEAFRINFAIRLALARLLAQRAGTALQMLIIDEGFGTQDAQGCERLIAAINAIASDFSCILTVTHMPKFKAAFQTRIEVSKTNQGSQINILT